MRGLIGSFVLLEVLVMARGTVWVRDELLVAFGLYCRIPFGKLHHGNPDVIKLAECLGGYSF